MIEQIIIVYRITLYLLDKLSPEEPSLHAARDAHQAAQEEGSYEGEGSGSVPGRTSAEGLADINYVDEYVSYYY